MSFYGNSSTKFLNVHHLQRIADNLSKAGWSWAVSQRLTPTGEQSGLYDAHRGERSAQNDEPLSVV